MTEDDFVRFLQTAKTERTDLRGNGITFRCPSCKSVLFESWGVAKISGPDIQCEGCGVTSKAEELIATSRPSLFPAHESYDNAQ